MNDDEQVAAFRQYENGILSRYLVFAYRNDKIVTLKQITVVKIDKDDEEIVSKVNNLLDEIELKMSMIDFVEHKYTVDDDGVIRETSIFRGIDDPERLRILREQGILNTSEGAAWVSFSGTAEAFEQQGFERIEIDADNSFELLEGLDPKDS